MIKFYPNGDRVMIRPLDENELKGITFSIIISGGQNKEAAQQGEVMEAGPTAEYNVGDFVIFNPAAGDTLRVPTSDGVGFIEMRIVHSDTIHSRFTL